MTKHPKIPVRVFIDKELLEKITAAYAYKDFKAVLYRNSHGVIHIKKETTK